MREKYGVSEWELFNTALDTAIGLGGRAASASETAERRRQRAAQAESATDVTASAEAFLAQMDPPALSAQLDESELLQRRGTQPIAMSGAAPEDRGRWEAARQDVMQEASSSQWHPAGAQTGGWVIDPLGEMAGRRSERVIGLEESGALQAPPIMATRMPAPQLQLDPSLQAAAPGQMPPGLQSPLMAQPAPQQQPTAYIPTTLGEAQAMAQAATTLEERAAAMEHIDQLAFPGGLRDAITGGHVERAQRAAGAWRPPRGETALDAARRRQVEQAILTSKALEDQRRKRTEALQADIDADAAKLFKQAAIVRKRDPEKAKRIAQLSYYLNNKGKFDSGEVTEEEWRSKSGVFADDEPSGVAFHAKALKLPKSSVIEVGKGAQKLISISKTRPFTPRPVPATLLTAKRKISEKIAADRQLLMLGEAELKNMARTNPAFAPTAVTASLVENQRQLREVDGQIAGHKAAQEGATGGATYSAPASAPPATQAPALVRGDDGVWRRP